MENDVSERRVLHFQYMKRQDKDWELISAAGGMIAWNLEEREREREGVEIWSHDPSNSCKGTHHRPERLPILREPLAS